MQANDPTTSQRVSQATGAERATAGGTIVPCLCMPKAVFLFRWSLTHRSFGE